MSDSNHAVILAGGEGTRLRPLTNSIPKPMLPVLGKPCIQYSVESLANGGIKEVYLACGYRSEDMISQLKDLKVSGVNLNFALEEKPAGTAGAVKLLEDRLGSTFIVTSGDVLADVDIQTLIEEHKRTGAIATMALTETDNPTEFGIVGLDSEGRVERFKEKPAKEEVFSNLINAGIYVLEKEALDYIPSREKFDFSKNLFPLLLEDNRRIQGSVLKGLWKDIGRPKDLLDANIRMAEKRGTEGDRCGAACSGKIVSYDFEGTGCSISGPSYVGNNVIIGKDAELTTCAVGSKSSIGQASKIFSSLLRENCSVGDNCSLKNVILGKGCTISSGTVLSDAVIGDGSRI